MVGQPCEHLGEPGARVDVIELAGGNQRIDRGGATPAFIRRDVMMPGVWAVRLSSRIRSTRYSGSPRLLSPIRCMAALVI